jgi:hypothetical protein
MRGLIIVVAAVVVVLVVRRVRIAKGEEELGLRRG